jgi:GT2 family glycosyltransferase
MSPSTGTPAVAVVVLNYNGLEDTLKCLSSLDKVEYPALSILLVDNGSSIDPAADVRRMFPAVHMLHTGANLGYAGGNNRGIERALMDGAEFVLILNNDTVVAPRIIDTLLDAFAANPSLGIIGPVINYMDERETVMTDGVQFNPGPGVEFFRRVPVPLEPGSQQVTAVDIVNGCCLMVRAEVLRTTGLFDERLFIVHEESDLCLRAAEEGFGCGVLGETLVWHKGSSAFDRSGRQLQRYFDARNLFTLLSRYAGRIGHSRPRARSLGLWLRYAFYRYSLELEARKSLAARAVVEGVWDALRGRTGPYRPGFRFGAPAVHFVFWLGHHIALGVRQFRGHS